MARGIGYMASSSLETSMNNKEIIPSHSSTPIGRYSFYKFSFMNDQKCTIKVNDETVIYLRENQGFTIDHFDCPIHSFKISEDGITYNWIGAYNVG
ncbi:hypothetical protein LCM23_06235 [Cytobacillus kochii]|uniref:hypothetical protein n=1 Tax=Cytobacillus kochii TaxID=859143 RepID=UPI001CD4F90C|nr:hypothetical protein [Cytobacillus kochii]MCA1025683.1 hypothetical protein [Cytobacillus kochii]